MASKPKQRTFIVLHRGQSEHGIFTTLGRYRVGARNEKEAEDLVKAEVGKHIKVKVYYEEKRNLLSHGLVIKESGKK